MNTKYHALSVNNIVDRANIAPLDNFDLTMTERWEMLHEAVYSFVRHADQFLTPHGLEMLPTGEVIGPVGTDVSQEFEEDFREHVAFWDDQDLVERWEDIDSSRVTPTVNWVDGTATLERLRDGEMVMIGEVEFEATEDPDTTYEALNEAFEAAGLDITWNADTADKNLGDISIVRAYDLGALK